ncbi:serine protease 58 isoform X1 [Oryctolagus cuniculus]|uniref:trypsin n=1 Tax=Oryctolagus cuniculus TaxID=9986 RepID=A0A5F9C8L7_RABIT
MKFFILSTLFLVTGAVFFFDEDLQESDNLLYLMYLNSSYQPCVGTLIAPKWVLTAAQCFLPCFWFLDWSFFLELCEEWSPSHCLVLLPKAPFISQYIDLQIFFHGGSRVVQDSSGEILSYEKIIIHPNFTVTSPKNDLMLIKLSMSLTFFYNMEFRLPTFKMSGVNSCLIPTWVQNKEYDGNSEFVQHTIKTFMHSDANCAKLLGSKFLEDMFCVGFVPGSREYCQGIRAAPAVCGNELQGIMSWETGCVLMGYISAFTNIYNHLPWINSIINTK